MKEFINDICYLDIRDDVPVLRFTPFDGFGWLNCGFSTRLGGVSEGCHHSLNLGFERGDVRENVIENFRRFSGAAGFDPCRICLPAQQHTNNIRIASDEHCCGPDFQKMTVEPVDGQITDRENVVLLAYGADCVPVFLADPVHHAVGLCHSGWKGTLHNIVSAAVTAMTAEYGTDPAALTAVIGPSISMDNYEVGPDVAGGFIDRFGIQVTDDSKVIRRSKREGRFMLDLWEACRLNLEGAGVNSEKIYTSGICTYKAEKLMYSHRRMGNGRGVMAGFMTIHSCTIINR